MWNVGDKIYIEFMKGEPQYAGKSGVIQEIGIDPWGNQYLRGTWGGLSIYESDGDKIRCIEEV